MNETSIPASRDRLIAAMTDALQRCGLHGVGLNELLSRAASPKGVLYHHFPGGKTELAVSAIDRVVTRLEGSLAALAEQPEPLQALADWLGQAERLLRDSGFERGCPLATVALESTADDDMLRGALAQGFARLRQAVSGLLERLGIAPPRAQALATLISGSPVRLHEWDQHFREVDIVISSTAAQKPILTRERLGPLIRDRLDRPLFIIDIAVPRDVAPEVHEMEGVFLYDIDSLQSIAQQSLALRREQMTTAESIIDEHVNDFSGWFTAARTRSIEGRSLRVSES